MSRAGIRFYLNGKKSTNTNGDNRSVIKYRFYESVRILKGSEKNSTYLYGRFPGLEVGDSILVEWVHYGKRKGLYTVNGSFQTVVTPSLKKKLDSGSVPLSSSSKPKRIGIIGGGVSFTRLISDILEARKYEK